MTSVPPHADVYRVLRPAMVALHVPDGAVYPTWEAFAPTKEDKKCHPVRVSVWDSTRTTVAQAKLLRIAAIESDSSRAIASELYAFALAMSDLVQLATRFDNQRVRAVLDPDGLVRDLALLPGADGHAGIEGLDRREGELKLRWKELLLAIARCCALRGD